MSPYEPGYRSCPLVNVYGMRKKNTTALALTAIFIINTILSAGMALNAEPGSIALNAASGSPALNAQPRGIRTAAQQYVKVLEGSEELRDAVWGVFAVKMNGDTVACHRPHTRMLPASNMKLITTGLALHELGADYRFSTRLAYSGELKEGVLDGDLYIVGGGDPTIASGDSISTPVKELFAGWMRQIKAAGIQRVEGRLVGDGRSFDGEMEHYSWQLEDLGYDYAPGGKALSFYENISKYRITPGKAAGDSVGVELLYPQMPWLSVDVTCATAAPKTGNDLIYVATDMAPVAQMRGTVEAGRKPFTMNCSNKYGALTCAYHFYKYLEANAFVVSQGPADVDASGRLRDFSDDILPHAPDVDGLHQIGITYSPSLSEIARKTNYESDNFYAEALMRGLSKSLTGSACYDSCAVAVSAALERLGVERARDIKVSDGSGLSRNDYVSPEFFVDFLKHMRTTPVWQTYLHSLPQPGKGTLTPRLRTASPELKARVYMKSGSMGGVRCFSGYIIPESGDSSQTIVFSVLTNNTIVPVSRINFCLDKLISLMAEEN